METKVEYGRVEIENGYIKYDIDTYGGLSGSGVLLKKRNSLFIIGVHTGKYLPYNKATLITKIRLKNIQKRILELEKNIKDIKKNKFDFKKIQTFEFLPKKNFMRLESLKLSKNHINEEVMDFLSKKFYKKNLQIENLSKVDHPQKNLKIKEQELNLLKGSIKNNNSYLQVEKQLTDTDRKELIKNSLKNPLENIGLIEGKEFLGTGVMIYPMIVLTAAHCVYSTKKAEEIKYYPCIKKKEDNDRKAYKVLKIIFPEDFNLETNTDEDYAILFLGGENNIPSENYIKLKKISDINEILGKILEFMDIQLINIMRRKRFINCTEWGLKLKMKKKEYLLKMAS